jgi:hypothetical protein
MSTVHSRSIRSAAKKAKPRRFEFSLILSGADNLTDELADAVYEAGCDDALLGMQCGVLYLDFEREAPSLKDAILKAIRQVERAKAGLRVVRVEPDDLVSAAEIARRVGRSRENIRQLVNGLRGPGGFPPPISAMRKKSPLWRWSEVAGWFTQSGLGDDEAVQEANLLGTINAALELRRRRPSKATMSQIWTLLNPGIKLG